MKINVPIIVDFNYVILEILKGMTVENDDYMYLEGFFDCRDMMIQAIEEFMDMKWRKEYEKEGDENDL